MALAQGTAAPGLLQGFLWGKPFPPCPGPPDVPQKRRVEAGSDQTARRCLLRTSEIVIQMLTARERQPSEPLPALRGGCVRSWAAASPMGKGSPEDSRGCEMQLKTMQEAAPGSKSAAIPDEGQEKEKERCWSDFPARSPLFLLITSSVMARQTCTKRPELLNFITAPTAGREMTSAARCGAAGVGQRLRRPPDQRVAFCRGCSSRHMFSLRAEFDLEFLRACFYRVDPQPGCHRKSWLCLHHQPSLKGFRGQARSRQRELVPASPGAAHVGPASAIWPWASTVNFGLLYF